MFGLFTFSKIFCVLIETMTHFMFVVMLCSSLFCNFLLWKHLLICCKHTKMKIFTYFTNFHLIFIRKTRNYLILHSLTIKHTKQTKHHFHKYFPQHSFLAAQKLNFIFVLNKSLIAKAALSLNVWSAHTFIALISRFRWF